MRNCNRACQPDDIAKSGLTKCQCPRCQRLATLWAHGTRKNMMEQQQTIKKTRAHVRLRSMSISLSRFRGAQAAPPTPTAPQGIEVPLPKKPQGSVKRRVRPLRPAQGRGPGFLASSSHCLPLRLQRPLVPFISRLHLGRGCPCQPVFGKHRKIAHRLYIGYLCNMLFAALVIVVRDTMDCSFDLCCASRGQGSQAGRKALCIGRRGST